MKKINNEAYTSLTTPYEIDDRLLSGNTIGKGRSRLAMMRVVVFLVLLAAVAAFNAMPTRSFSVGSLLSLRVLYGS